MILNTFSLISLFVGFISLFLMAAAVLSALHFYRQMRSVEGADNKFRAKDRIHLSFLLLATAFLIRLASWPLFYILLQSYIPLVPGAMCIYGATRVMPAFTAFLQILKPLAFFLIGGWLILYRLDLSLNTHPLTQKIIRFLAVASAAAIIDGAAELLFILIFSPPGVTVTCCTAVADIRVPSSILRPAAFFAAPHLPVLIASYHGFNIGLIALIGLLLLRKSFRAIPRSLLALVAFVASISSVVTYAAYREHLGPKLMNLPDHHCLYCLLQYRPISAVILGLFILGVFSAIWPLLLNQLAKSDEAAERLSSLTRNLLKWALVCLSISWLMATALS